MRNHSFLFLVVFLVIGCSGTSSRTRSGDFSQENMTINQETAGSLKTVADSLAGHELTENEMKELSREMRKDPDARSAVQSVTEAMSGQNSKIKFCPVDGKRYSAKFEKCPEHDVPLEELGE